MNIINPVQKLHQMIGGNNIIKLGSSSEASQGMSGQAPSVSVVSLPKLSNGDQIKMTRCFI